MKDKKSTMKRLEKLLMNQKVERVTQYNGKELVITFETGRTLFVDSKTDLEFSVTEGKNLK